MNGIRKELAFVRTLPEADWRGFVDGHPDGNVFHTPEMFEVFRRTRGYLPELWAAVGGGDVLALLLPVKISLMKGWLGRWTTRAVVFGSVLCAPGSEGADALSGLLRTYLRDVKGSLLFTELRNLNNLDGFQPVLQECGFTREDHLNYLIDLDMSPEALIGRFGRHTRRNILRGLRRGNVVVREAVGPDDLAAAYDLLRKSYRAARVPLSDPSLFEAAMEVLRPKKMVRFTLALVGRIPVAASIDLLYKRGIYGWYGGFDRAFRAHVPNELMMWDVLRWGAANGYVLYDFGGAGRPDEEYGVRDFKAKFAGELVSYGRNLHVHSPFLYRLAKAAYGFRVRRRKRR